MAAPTFVSSTETGGLNSDVATMNFQASGTDAVLVFASMYKHNTVLVADSVVFNSTENFTLVHAATDGGQVQLNLYVLTGPSLTTADAVLTYPSSVRMYNTVSLYNGVDQTNPFTNNSVDEQADSDAVSATIVSSTEELIVEIVAQVGFGPSATATVGADNLRRDGLAVGGGKDIRVSLGDSAGEASHFSEWTYQFSGECSILMAALQAPQPGPSIPTVMHHRRLIEAS
jgi:hypothetical protein